MRLSEREALLPNSACCKCLCLWLPCGVWLNWYTRRQQHELAPHTQPGVNEDGAPATAPPAAQIPASAAQHTYSRAKDIAKRTFDGTWYAVPRGMVLKSVAQLTMPAVFTLKLNASRASDAHESRPATEMDARLSCCPPWPQLRRGRMQCWLPSSSTASRTWSL